MNYEVTGDESLRVEEGGVDLRERTKAFALRVVKVRGSSEIRGSTGLGKAGLRGRLKNREGSREGALGRMARRERRASTVLAVRSEQRRQTAQGAFALRVAGIFGLGCVVPQSQTAAGMLLRHALPKPKILATRPIPIF